MKSLPSTPRVIPVLGRLAAISLRRKDLMMVYYVALALGSGVMAVDIALPPIEQRTLIVSVRGHDEEIGPESADGWGKSKVRRIYWSKVELANGSTFRTERMSGNFKVGTEVDVQLTPLLERVAGYRSTGGRDYNIVEAFSIDLKPFPFLVLACSLLLVMPWWKTETIWALRGVLIIGLFAWLLSVIGTSGGW